MMKDVRTYRSKCEKGFTLIEAAITLAIIGLLTAAVISLYDSSKKQAYPRETRERMEVIISALSNYVETYSRLPCPADPSLNDALFGWEWNVAPNPTVAAGGTPIGSCDGGAGELTGIVPFQTLNLPADAVRDAWGNYFTYAVSPVFTLDNDANAPNPFGYLPNDNNDDVHERCRDGVWVDLLDNVNAPKARFCCAVDFDDPAAPGFYRPSNGNNRDLVVSIHTIGTIVSPVRDDPQAGPPEGNYGDMRDPIIDGPPAGNGRLIPATGSITAPAFVLVSHGEDGMGAFLGNNTPNQVPTNGAFAQQQENWDGDRNYFIGPANLNAAAAATYFDDIVVWMTQDGIMAANGTSSCQQP